MINELTEDIGVSRRTIVRDLDFLQKQNRLKRIGGRKNGYWEAIE